VSSPLSGATRTGRWWPVVVVAAGVLIGLVISVLGRDSWRLGGLVIGCALLVGAVIRVVLPRREAGLLAVRSRAFDILAMTIGGVAIIALAIAIPGR
jgi:hypothetical protein